MPSSADPNEWSVANNIYQDPFPNQLIQGSEKLVEWPDFKMTLYFTRRDRFYIVATKKRDCEARLYALSIPADWTEYTFSINGFYVTMSYDDNNELHTETWFNFIDGDFTVYEDVDIDPDQLKPKESKPARLPWQSDELEESRYEDVMSLIDEALGEE